MLHTITLNSIRLLYVCFVYYIFLMYLIQVRGFNPIFLCCWLWYSFMVWTHKQSFILKVWVCNLIIFHMMSHLRDNMFLIDSLKPFLYIFIKILLFHFIWSTYVWNFVMYLKMKNVYQIILMICMAYFLSLIISNVKCICL